MEFLRDLLEIINKEAMVISMAALPVVELRGAIPVAISMGFHPLHAYILALIGSTIPAPVILIAFRPVIGFLKQRVSSSFAERVINRLSRKGERIKRYYIAGLFLFVAIPLPSTGVWTGSMAAALLGMRILHALPAILLGNVVAGLIVLVISYGLLG